MSTGGASGARAGRRRRPQRQGGGAAADAECVTATAAPRPPAPRTAEEVWRALKATQRQGEGHPRVTDMVREVERMTGAAAADVAAAQVLDTARRGHLTRSPAPPDLVRIAQLVARGGGHPTWSTAAWLTCPDGSLRWDGLTRAVVPGDPAWAVVGVLCVLVALELLAAPAAATPAAGLGVAIDGQHPQQQQQEEHPAAAVERTVVGVGAPLNVSSARALAMALVALDGCGVHFGDWWAAEDDHDDDDDEQQRQQRVRVLGFRNNWARLSSTAAAKEVEVMYAALALNRSITSLRLPISLRRQQQQAAGSGGGSACGGAAPCGWDLDAVQCRHLRHLLSANSTIQEFVLDAGPGAGALWLTPPPPLALGSGEEEEEEVGDAEGAPAAAMPSSDVVVVDGSASPAAATAAAASGRSSSSAVGWTNSTLQTLRCTMFFPAPYGPCYGSLPMPWPIAMGDAAAAHDLRRRRGCVHLDGVLELVAHLHALRDVTITHAFVHRHVPPLAWSQRAVRLFDRIMTTTHTLAEVKFGDDSEAPPAVVDCLARNRGTLETLELELDVRGYEALFKLLTPPPAPASGTGTGGSGAVSASLRCLRLRDLMQHQYCPPEEEDEEENWEHTAAGTAPAESSTTTTTKATTRTQEEVLDRRRRQRQKEVEALAAMLATNTRLLSLVLTRGTHYTVRQWADAILPALARNRTLTFFSASGTRNRRGAPEFHDRAAYREEYCDHRRDGGGVYAALVSMLQQNTTLQTICIKGTPLDHYGRAAAMQARLEERNMGHKGRRPARGVGEPAEESGSAESEEEEEWRRKKKKRRRRKRFELE